MHSQYLLSSICVLSTDVVEMLLSDSAKDHRGVPATGAGGASFTCWRLQIWPTCHGGG